MNEDIKAIEVALTAGPTAGEWKHLGNAAHVGSKCVFTTDARDPQQRITDARYLAACDPARLRRVLDTVQALSGSLAALLPMMESWREDYSYDVGDKEAPAMDAARAALALYEGKQ